MRALTKGEDRTGREPRRAFRTLLLLTRRFEIYRGRCVSVAVPMLAGYGFVQFDAQLDDWHAVLACAGVRELMLTTSLRPSPVADSVIQRLAKMSVRDTDLVAGPAGAARQPGEGLRVIDGPFTSSAATVIQCDGIMTTAEVSIFGRSSPVTLPWASFEAV